MPRTGRQLVPTPFRVSVSAGRSRAPVATQPARDVHLAGSMATSSGPAQDWRGEVPQSPLPSVAPVSPAKAVKWFFPSAAQPLASVEEAFSEVVAITTDATRLLPATLVSIFAAAWPVIAKAWTQPVGDTVRILTAGTCALVSRLSELAAAAATILAAGAAAAAATTTTTTTSRLAATSATAQTATATSTPPSAVYDTAAANKYLEGTAFARHAVLATSCQQVLELTRVCTCAGKPFAIALMPDYTYFDKSAQLDALAEMASASGSLLIACSIAPGFYKRAAAAADMMGTPEGWDASAADVERQFGLDVALASRIPGARNRGILEPVTGMPAFMFGGWFVAHNGPLSNYACTSGCELPLSSPFKLLDAMGIFKRLLEWRQKQAAVARLAVGNH
ncbi:hypothetical protein CHLRE_03g207377v5 [Chlamydomonas reinhardtii]|nr:uncharacterized protein CHLRE_03g207377v5 [Chlamydomonas reinhardtii]PNW86034.1 hypothetical protein CHLRE_03g207377v5 [Chlamydomonas reinhardtii]